MNNSKSILVGIFLVTFEEKCKSSSNKKQTINSVLYVDLKIIFEILMRKSQAYGVSLENSVSLELVAKKHTENI